MNVYLQNVLNVVQCFRLRISKKCDNRFSEINIRPVNAGIASGNGVSNMQRIMTL